MDSHLSFFVRAQLVEPGTTNSIQQRNGGSLFYSGDAKITAQGLIITISGDGTQPNYRHDADVGENDWVSAIFIEWDIKKTDKSIPCVGLTYTVPNAKIVESANTSTPYHGKGYLTARYCSHVFDFQATFAKSHGKLYLSNAVIVISRDEYRWLSMRWDHANLQNLSEKIQLDLAMVHTAPDAHPTP